jgi:hypothetical protein
MPSMRVVEILVTTAAADELSQHGKGPTAREEVDQAFGARRVLMHGSS